MIIYASDWLLLPAMAANRQAKLDEKNNNN